MDHLQVLIADDQPGIRELLRKIVERIEGVRCVGEAEDGEAALRRFSIERPEVVFLDVEMPLLSGIECARRIAEIEPKTFFIFATAHEEYMTEAFEVYAADYLIKPFKAERVVQTIERLKAIHLQSEAFEKAGTIRPVKPLAKLFIKNKDGVVLVDMAEIILVQREEGNTVIYTGSDRYTTSESLGEIEEKLDPGGFFRAHKSYIINLMMIEKIYPYGRWTYLVKLKNTERDALMTTERYEELERIFQG